MRRIESTENDMKGIVTFEFEDGRRIDFDKEALRAAGLANLMRRSGLGHLLPTERLPVFHHGQRVGTMAPDFDPTLVTSNNYFYNPRPGDFRREGDTWIAAKSLGPGDVGAVVGFIPEHPAYGQSTP